MITPQTLIRHELIGLPVSVVKARNPAYCGISGRILDETRNMLVILASTGPKWVEKKGTTFLFHLPDGARAEVDGSALVAQPEKRISMRKNNR
ncbi:ribonuclease P protein component 1 [Methanofollis fontis]|uniref:Ribonuclease P protein component 1 n=1 Tax=Methanofollis fontis TaxID=2052832 RepID=A0A483CQ58_9EURY|nr:ribonuclease P protein component 1 [Methanofollis fontis]TAJ45265.1 ribonuclease P [Methanofollis fontis]